MSLKLILFLLPLLMPIITTGCSSSQMMTCSPGEQPVMLDSLYFGTANPDGIVTAEEWETFIAETVVPGFPDGLTSWAVSGHWGTSAGAVKREVSYLLHLAHNGAPEKDAAIQHIMRSYKKQFQQEAVMRIRSQACRSF
jgi:hypothetical protein